MLKVRRFTIYREKHELMLKLMEETCPKKVGTGAAKVWKNK